MDEVKAQAFQSVQLSNDLAKINALNQNLESQRKELQQQEIKNKEKLALLQQQLYEQSDQPKKWAVQQDLNIQNTENILRDNQLLEKEKNTLKQQIQDLQEQSYNQEIEGSKNQVQVNELKQQINELNNKLTQLQQSQSNLAKHKEVQEDIINRLKSYLPSFELQSKFGKLVNSKIQMASHEIEKQYLEERLQSLEQQAKQILYENQDQSQLEFIRRQIEQQRSKAMKNFQIIQELIRENKQIESEIYQLDMKERKSSNIGYVSSSYINYQEPSFRSKIDQPTSSILQQQSEEGIYETNISKTPAKERFSQSVIEEQYSQAIPNRQNQSVLLQDSTSKYFETRQSSQSRYANYGTLPRFQKPLLDTPSRFEKYHRDFKE